MPCRSPYSLWTPTKASGSFHELFSFFFLNLPESLYTLAGRTGCLISDVAEVQANLMDGKQPKTPGATSSHYFNSLSRTSGSHERQVGGANSSRTIQPLEGMEQCVPGRFFFSFF